MFPGAGGGRVYGRADSTEVKRVLRLVPVEMRTAMMTAAMRPTIRPYSMAVAPFCLRG